MAKKKQTEDVKQDVVIDAFKGLSEADELRYQEDIATALEKIEGGAFVAHLTLREQIAYSRYEQEQAAGQAGEDGPKADS